MTGDIGGGVQASVVAAARFRLAPPAGEADDVSPFYEDEIEGFWVVPMFSGDAGRVVVVMTEAGAVAAHAGLPRAAARLRALAVLEHDPVWVSETIRPLLDAVGGLTPGCPRYPGEEAELQADGTLKLVLTAPEPWVHYAAGGGKGPPPPIDLSQDARGATPPAAMGTMEMTLDRDYALSWRYWVRGEELGGFAGRPEDDTPDLLAPLVAEERIAAGRRRLRSPLAVPSAPAGEHVALLGLGTA